MAQSVILSAISVILNTSADMVVVLFTGALGTRLKRQAAFRAQATHGIWRGHDRFGVYVAAADSR